MRIIWALALLVLLLAFAPLAYAHHCHNGCRGHHCSDCGDCTDCTSGARQPAANPVQASVSGDIAEVVYLPGADAGTAGVEVVLNTEPESTRVKLATSGVLKRSGVALKEGQPLTVRGFWVETADGELLVAAELEYDGRTVRLRGR